MKKFGKLLSHKVQGQTVTLHFEQGDASVSVVTDQIMRVFAQLDGPAVRSKAIEGDPVRPAQFSVRPGENGLEIASAGVTAVVHDGFLVDFYDPAGSLLCADTARPRRPLQRVPERMAKLMGGEGHRSAAALCGEYPVQVVKALGADEKFYGLGDKTGFLNKRGYEYENWNTSTPAAQTDAFKALYKSIPFYVVLKGAAAFGLFYDNTCKAYFDFGKESPDYYFYAAEGGSLDYYFLAGPDFTRVVENYAHLTGTTPLPQRWTLGYHQSRFGYENAADVLNTVDRFRSNGIPCDVMHLDIDYMDGHKVFTWNEQDFGDFQALTDALAERGVHVVTINDPGVKQEPGYRVYDEAMEKGYFLKNRDGKLYSNRVWAGLTAFPDFGRKEVRAWWSEKQRFLTDHGVAGIWNDMNEPRAFDGDLPDDLPMTDEDRVGTHGELHNVYGHMMNRATFDGLKAADGRRPFVITRACYAGSQKYACTWTGDNHSIWAHLQMALVQLLNLGVSGYAFCGTDVGGFGSDTTPELLCRWTQLGVFSPLFRNHSSMGTRRQEPFAFDEQTMQICRKAIRLRYELLPYIYDLFRECEQTGLPLMRPVVMHYQHDPNTAELNGEFLFGEQMLVAPVLEQGATKKMVYLPAGVWYDYAAGTAFEGGRWHLVDAPLDTCPVFVKAGAVIPTCEVRPYIPDEGCDTLKLRVYPGRGEYRHYQDNGSDYAYRDGAYNSYRFVNCDQTITTTMEHEGYPTYARVEVLPIGNA